jgi:hypothetical protein
MHHTHLLGGALLIAAIGWFVTGSGSELPVQPPAQPPVADGHFALVVQGDRDQLTITHAVPKADPWAGVPKGLTSTYALRIRGADGALLAELPIDLSHFDLAADRKGGAIQVEGCEVRDPHVTTLVNVPRFAAAASYAFARRDIGGEVALGSVTGDQVRELAGGGR